MDSAVELRIIMVGRMSIQKNPMMAVEACGRLKSDAWHLHLVGNGPLIPEVEALVAKLGLERHVTFHGWLDTQQVQRLLRESDVMLMPSRSEGMPVAAIEALKHGVAIIGSRIPGLQDVLLDDKTGIACDMSAESFSQALERVMLDASTLRNLRIGAQQHSINFNLDTIVHRYQECMLRTIN
jgi:glycosyltransferase involved in cell wall biosynthesis